MRGDLIEPIQIRTRGAGVRVWTDTGTDDLKNTHGLPVSNTRNIDSGGLPVS